MKQPAMLDGQGKARYRVRMHINAQWDVATLKEARTLAAELRGKHADVFNLSVELWKLVPGKWLGGWIRWASGWKRIRPKTYLGDQ